MVMGLDGIERLVHTLNPETNKPDVYHCNGYRNVGSEGHRKLVDWYKPLSGEGQYHSLEFLKLRATMFKLPYEITVKGQEVKQ